jgi:hypothetical protein
MPRRRTVKLTPEIQEKICWALRVGNYGSGVTTAPSKS